MGDAVRLKYAAISNISCIIAIPCCFWCGCMEMHLKSVYDWCSMIIKNYALKSFLCTVLLIILKVFNLSNNITVIKVDTLIDWLFDWLCLKSHHQYFSLLTAANRQEISRRASYLQDMLRNSEIYRYAKKSGKWQYHDSCICHLFLSYLRKLPCRLQSNVGQILLRPWMTLFSYKKNSHELSHKICNSAVLQFTLYIEQSWILVK